MLKRRVESDDGGGEKKSKRCEEDHDESILEEAFDVVSEYILVGQLLPSGIPIQHAEYSNLQLGDTKYINASLRKCLRRCSSSPPPPCSLIDLVYNEKDAEYSGKAVLEDCDNKPIIFFAHGKFNNAKGLGFFRLVGTKDEYLMMRELYYKCETMMSIFETSSCGEYEWRHVLPNSFFKKFYPIGDKLTTYCAKERYGLPERQKFYEAVEISKKTGKSVEVERVEVSGFSLPPGVFVTYLYTDPNTKSDIVSSIIFDGDVLRQARARIAEMKDFFEYAPMMMGVVELRGDSLILLYCNSETLPLMRDDSPQSVIIHEEYDKELIRDFVALYKESRKNKSVMTADMFDRSTKRHITVIVSTISYDEENNLSKHVYMVMDKTKQRNTELELEKYKDSLEEKIQQRTIEVQEKESQLRHLVSTAPNIILTVNREGVVQFANRHFVSDDGGLLVGKYLYTMVAEGNELMEKLGHLFDTRKCFKGLEVKLVEKDIWITLSAGFISEHLAIVIATDISELKRMSEQLNLALATKSRFLANMSHEVRTPLSGIIGMSRILQETELTLDQTECVNTIQYCGETLLSEINSILDYTKLEASGENGVAMTLDRSEISLQNCVEESLYQERRGGSARQKRLELIVDVDPRVPDRILGDLIRLRQVMLNLLNNAVKFTDVGYILVTLTGASAGEGSDAWKIRCTIRDTGCGVPPESQGKLFQMFSQVDVSSTRRYGGTGIGLALAKRFLEMMDGDITMQSSGVPGEGSTFSFSISATPAPFVPLSPSHLSPRWLTSSTHVYIIESCKEASEVLKKRLFAKGFVNVQIVSEKYYEAFQKILEKISEKRQLGQSGGLSVNSEKKQLSQSGGQSINSDHLINTVVFCDIETLEPGLAYPLKDCKNVATVFMGYLRPQSLEVEYTMNEFLRKPIKEAMLVACLREIWIKFFDKPRASHGTPSASIPNPAVSKQNPAANFPLNILVAEDNEVNQKVIKRVFQHLGYKMAIADNGVEAMKWIEQNGLPDMILMDVQMPVMDGIQTTRLIREKYPSSRVFIVAMTANAFPEDRKSCFEAGMNDFLTKPLRVEQLQIILQKCYKTKAPLHVNNTNSNSNANSLIPTQHSPQINVQ